MARHHLRIAEQNAAARANRPALPAHGAAPNVAASLAAWSDVVDNDELHDILILLNETAEVISDAERNGFLEAVKFLGYNALAMLKKLVTSYHQYMVANDQNVQNPTLRSFQGAVTSGVLLALSRGGNVVKIAQRSSDEGKVLINQLTGMFDIKKDAATAGAEGCTLFRLASLFPHVCLEAVYKKQELLQLPRSVCAQYGLPKGLIVFAVPGMASVLADDRDVKIEFDNDEIDVGVRLVKPLLLKFCFFMSGISTTFLARRMNKPVNVAMEKSMKGLCGAANAADSPFRGAVYTSFFNHKIIGGRAPLLKLIQFKNSDDATQTRYEIGLTTDALTMLRDLKDAVPLSRDVADMKDAPGWAAAGDPDSWIDYAEESPFTNSTSTDIQLNGV